jgi:hypothetical protein
MDVLFDLERIEILLAEVLASENAPYITSKEIDQNDETKDDSKQEKTK